MTQNSVHVDIHKSSVVVTRLKLDKYYKKKKILGGTAKSQQVGKKKDEYKEEMIEKMQ